MKERDLPQHWRLTSLGDVVEINPRERPTAISDSTPISFVPMAAVQELTGIADTASTRPWGEVKKGYTPMRDGDVIFAKITPCMENGKVALVTGMTDGLGMGSTEFVVLRSTDAIEPRYLLHYMLQEQVRSDARQVMQGAAGQLRVPQSFFQNLQIAVAPIEDQQRIIAVIEERLSQLDSAVRSLEAARDKLEVHRRAVLSAAFSAGESAAGVRRSSSAALDYDRDSRQRGSWAFLSALIAPTRAMTYGVIKLGTPIEGGVPTLRSSNVRSLRLELDYVKPIAPALSQDYRRTILRGGEIVITVRGTLGGVAVVPASCAGFNVSREVAVVPLSDCSLAPILSVFIAAPQVQQWLLRRARGIAYTGINIETLRVLPLPIPPAPDRARILEYVEKQLTVAQHTAAEIDIQLARAARLRQSILKHGFEGKLVPEDPDDEPTSVLLKRIRVQRAGGEAERGSPRRSAAPARARTRNRR